MFLDKLVEVYVLGQVGFGYISLTVTSQ